MSFEDIKSLIMTLDAGDQKRLITEIVPQVWGKACDDPSCACKLKELVDRDIVRPYDETFMGGI
ncbi:conserved hypothetical protein [Syntrophobacter sp. SbD1]|nr:conserved hypothetical protein [Syntrophobacter sp. SbD1]